MNIADEGTTAHLKADIHCVKRMSQVDLRAAIESVNKCFVKWNLPKCIKIDNGYPFVNPNYRDIPTKAKLWWIGLGIEVIQNTPGKPQENGAVECLQGICYRWVNPIVFDTPQDLQLELDEISDFQRNYYRMPKRSYMTRIECHPELAQNPRKYDSDNFNIDRVYQYLATCLWQRTIKGNGSTHFFGKAIYIGTRYADQKVYITFDPIELQWIFRSTRGNFFESLHFSRAYRKRNKRFRNNFKELIVETNFSGVTTFLRFMGYNFIAPDNPVRRVRCCLRHL